MSSVSVFSSAAALALILGLSACAGVQTTPVPQDDLPYGLRPPPPPPPFSPPPGAFVTINAEVPLGEAAVWRGAPSLEPCRDPGGPITGRPAPAACLVEGLRESGAPGAALTAADWLSSADGDPGWLTDWRREGPVGIASVTRPFRANTNVETLLVPTQGPALYPDATPLAGFEADAHWTGFRARNPNAFPVAPFDLVASEKHLTGWRLIYGAPLRDCRACADLGRMLVAYDFDSTGAFTGRSLLYAN